MPTVCAGGARYSSELTKGAKAENGLGAAAGGFALIWILHVIFRRKRPARESSIVAKEALRNAEPAFGPDFMITHADPVQEMSATQQAELDSRTRSELKS